MSDRSATTKAAFWVGVVFLLGAALGGMIGYVSAHKSYAAGPPPPPTHQQKIEHLTQELQLTPAQQKQLDGILTGMEAQYKAIHQQTDPLIDQARQHGRNQIRAILTPEQLPKFEDFLHRIDEERKKNGR
jgi:Spy/CpxP family protein refolding chaperone